MAKNPNNPLEWPNIPFDPKFPGGPVSTSQATPAAHGYLWVGRILHVDVETMVCSIQLETGTGERYDIPLPASGGGGPRSWSGIVPERNSKVVLGWRKYDQRGVFVPYIIEFMTVGTFPAREFEPFSTVDPADAAEAIAIHPELEDDPHVNLDVVRVKSRKAYSGDYLASSSSGSDLILDRSVYLTNRAGNEFILRDSDQTTVLQTVNEFVSNAAGYYRRGLVKRDSFNFLPDLAISGFDPSVNDFDTEIEGKFVVGQDDDGNDLRSILTQVDVGSPAYDKLLEFGLVNPDGTPVEFIDNDPDDPRYPFVVTPDGQRQSYVVLGEHEFGFDQTDQCYVEDRVELRHTSDGVMAVTEDGDGIQIDPVPPILIEDVRGTVVGNDPYTEPGRSLYKRILAMRVFDDPDQGSPSLSPTLEPVDTITSQTEANTKALCRLFKVQSPTSSNQYVFGISKEGRVFLHIPKSQTGTTQEKGKSVDANVLGLIKAIIGADDTRTSLDIRTQGGVKLDLGGFLDDTDPENPALTSVELNLKGKIRTIYSGEQGRESFIGGSDLRSVTASSMDSIGGSCVRNVGGADATEAFSITQNAGFGGLKQKCAGDYNNTVLGKTTELYAQPRLSTFALADTKTMLAGLDTTVVLAGGITRNVVAGTGITDSVAAGNFVMSAGVGNMLMNVGTGNLAASVAAGNLALSAGAGNVSMAAGVTATMAAGSVAAIASPITKIGLTAVGFAVAGIPGPLSPHLDYVTGLPLLGIPTVSLG